uniref:LSM11, U7 small nuclear RNA associated n=1 Tax=Eptatretus burgeri TaxID=7764 RepID=A0A8C4RC41_EPTBU
MAGAPEGREDPRAENPKFDFTSSTFDPEAALQSHVVRLPRPQARCFNNLAEYVSFMLGKTAKPRTAAPRSQDRRSKRPGKAQPDPERRERLRKLMVKDSERDEQALAARRRHKAPKNVLTKMLSHKDGPLDALRRCVLEQIRVSVHVRTFKGLRGICTGFVAAYDKFWNLALVDVDEIYRKPLLGKAYYHEQQLTVNRLFSKLRLQEGRQGELEGEESGQSAVSLAQTEVQRGFEAESFSEKLRETPQTVSCKDRRHLKTPPSGDQRHSFSDSEMLFGRSSASVSEAATGDLRKSSRCITHPRGILVSTSDHDIERSHSSHARSSSKDSTVAAARRKAHRVRRREEMERVYKRHVNQLFLRGDNIILVVLHGTHPGSLLMKHAQE